MTAFATDTDLASYLQETFTTAQIATADLLLNMASDEIRSVTGQHVDVITNDVIAVAGTPDFDLILPQRPATQPTDVKVNGTTVTDWSFDGRDTLYRQAGWMAYDAVTGAPLRVQVTYTHGWTTPPAELKRVAIQAAARAFRNPGGLQRWETGSEREMFAAANDGTHPEVNLTDTEIAVVRRALGVSRRRTIQLSPGLLAPRGGF